MYFSSFSTIFVLNIFALRRTERDMFRNVYRSSTKVPVIHVRFLVKHELFRHGFSQNTHILNFMKIRAVGTELFHADRRTDGRT